MCPGTNYLLITSKESRSFNLELCFGLLKTLNMSHLGVIWAGEELGDLPYPQPPMEGVIEAD